MIKFQGIGAQGNYSQAGKAVADDTLRSFLAARRNSPNYGEMAITAADIRKTEKLATLKNQAEVAATRLTADADVKAKKMQIDSASKLKTAKRKAGALAVAGQMATEAGALFGQEKRQLRELGGDDTYYNNQTALINKRRGEIETRMEEGYGTKSEPSTESPTSTTSLPVSTQSSDGWANWSKVIRAGEGTPGADGYQTMFGGGKFSDMSKHPDQVVSKSGYNSSAAGAYQFLTPTWNMASKALNLTDFSPASQEKAGRYLAEKRGLNINKPINTIEEFRTELDKIAPEWASMPYSGKGVNGGGYGTSYYGQGGISLEEAYKLFKGG
jgi:muramidase (phage lysozyme)